MLSVWQAFRCPVGALTLAELHGGRLIESEPEKGTIVTVLLPFERFAGTAGKGRQGRLDACVAG